MRALRTSQAVVRLPSIQAGQGLVEGLLGLAVLVVMFWAVGWVGRQLDLVQQLAHASRHAAFVAATQPAATESTDVLSTFWLGQSHQRWRRADGTPLLRDGTERAGQALLALEAQAQPGASLAAAARLRREWGLQDRGLRRHVAEVTLQEIRAWGPDGSAPSLAGRRLRRQTTLLVDAGASPDDGVTTARLEQGALGWAAAARQSRALGRQLSESLQPLDRGWDRAAPRWNWVESWQYQRPARPAPADPAPAW